MTSPFTAATTTAAFLVTIGALLSPAAAAPYHPSTPTLSTSITSASHTSVLTRCRLVSTLRRAGFTGRDVRIAWAVVMRESGGDSRQITNGADYGLFQINRPTHPGYSRAALLNGDSNARIARRMVNRSGWRPWGLNRSGTAVDARDYRGIWNQWKIDNWIWKPYARYYAQYPKGC